MPVVSPTSENLASAAQALREGLTVGVPTETVYGLAASGLQVAAAARIFEIKNRPTFDPLILHIPPDFDLTRIARSISPVAQLLMTQFWPGPLTLILPKTDRVPDLVTSGFDSVAVRCPSHPVMQELLRLVDFPLAAPSANRFGRISPTTAQAVQEELGEAPAFIIDGGPCSLGIESTIVDCTVDPPVLLRPGAVTLEELLAATPIRVPERSQGKDNEAQKAPGLLLSHYAPRIPLYLSHQSLSSGREFPQDVAFLVWKDLPTPLPKTFRVLAPSGKPREAATRLFQLMRELDASGAERILVDPIPTEGLGAAILDRLTRASSGMV
jgi:L-threonylcarbamoyladenylate synthase